MGSRFLTELKEVYGQDIEHEFDMFTRGELCLITEFKGKGICYLFRYGKEFAACDGSSYLEQDAFPAQKLVEYFLDTKPFQRIKVNLEQVISEKIDKVKDGVPFVYFSSKHNFWTQYYWLDHKYLRIVTPVSKREKKQTFDLGEKEDLVICDIVAKTIEKAA